MEIEKKMVYVNPLWNPLALKPDFRFLFSFGGLLDPEQRSAIFVSNKKVCFLFFQKGVVKAIFPHELPGRPRHQGLDQQHPKILFQGVAHGFFIHFFQDIMDGKALVAKLHIKELDPRLIGKHNPGLVAGIGLDQEKAGDAVARDFDIGLIPLGLKGGDEFFKASLPIRLDRGQPLEHRGTATGQEEVNGQ